MRTIGSPAVLAALTNRLRSLTATQARVWGAMNAHQMLVHLGDGAEAALGRRSFSVQARRANPILKWVALTLPLSWPRGLRTGADPAAQTVVAEDFIPARDRAVRTLRELAAAPASALAARHPIFGAMSRPDWHRWAFRHTDHHLRQFGL